MKYKLKKKLICEFATYMYKRKKPNNFEGNRYFYSPNVKMHW